MRQEKKSQFTVRALTEGALMAGIAALFGLINIYIPVLGIVTGLVWAIPIILLVMRHDMKLSVMGLAVTGMLMALLAGPVQAILFLTNLGGIALVYGYSFKYKLSPLKALLLGTLIAAVSMAATVVLSAFIANLPVAQWMDSLKKAVDQAFEMYGQMGVLDKVLPQGVTVEQYKEQLITMIKTLLPSLFVAGAMGMALINYLVARKILLRLGYEIPEMPRFRDWHFPWYIVWGVIAGLGLVLLGNYLSHRLILTIGQNILNIYYPFLLISGVSLLIFFWKSSHLTQFMKTMIILIGFMFSSIFFSLILVAGLFDPLFDYRRLIRERTDEQ